MTQDARVGLVYKRDVLQALWQALHENVELNIGDLADMCPFPSLFNVIEVRRTKSSGMMPSIRPLNLKHSTNKKALCCSTA